jgi:transcriptional regulator with XRE-family HTH domain
MILRNVQKRRVKVKPRFKRKPPRIYLKEWRDFFGYTQEETCDRLETMCGFAMSVATLSRLESSTIPAQTHQLSALAVVYSTTIAALVSRPPKSDAGIKELIADLSTEDEAAVISLIQAYQAGKRAAG